MKNNSSTERKKRFSFGLISSKKKASISIAILILGVFFVFLLAIISFSFSINKFSDSFGVVGVLENLNLQMEHYNFEVVHGTSSSKPDNSFSIKIINGKKYFYIEKFGRAHWYSLEKTKFLFSVRMPVQ